MLLLLALYHTGIMLSYSIICILYYFIPSSLLTLCIFHRIHKYLLWIWFSLVVLFKKQRLYAGETAAVA